MSKKVQALATGLLNGLAGAIRKKRADAPLPLAGKPATPLNASKAKAELSEFENAWENDLPNVEAESDDASNSEKPGGEAYNGWGEVNV